MEDSSSIRPMQIINTIKDYINSLLPPIYQEAQERRDKMDQGEREEYFQETDDYQHAFEVSLDDDDIEYENVTQS